MPQVAHWCAGTNLVGYSSDPDTVQHGGTLEEAIDYLMGELHHLADYAFDEEEAREFEYAADVVDCWNADAIAADAERRPRRGGCEVVTVRNHEYWVMPCFDEACDQVDEV